MNLLQEFIHGQRLLCSLRGIGRPDTSPRFVANNLANLSTPDTAPHARRSELYLAAVARLD